MPFTITFYLKTILRISCHYDRKPPYNMCFKIKCREERAARFKKEKEEKEKVKEEARLAKLSAQQQNAAAAEARRRWVYLRKQNLTD